MFIKDLYKCGPVVSFEVFPPKKDSEPESIYRALEEMSALKPDFISVTYGAGGLGNINRTAEIASEILRKHETEPLAHLTCVGADANRIVQSLNEFREGGVRNILALRGDLPEEEAKAGKYSYAEELIREIRLHGDFCIGAACYPEGHIDCDSLKQDSEHALRKQEAGAEFMITQLCFDNDIIYRFLERMRKRGVTVPISAGIMPILGRGQIERMVFMCGVSLPSVIVKLLHKYENNPDDLRAAGIEYAANQIEGLLRQGADGIHIYTMNKPEIARTCMARTGRNGT